MILPYRSARRIAELISDRLTTHLAVAVSVVDQNEVVIASNQPGTVGFPIDPRRVAGHHLVRVPLPLDGEQWEVVLLTREDSAAAAQALAQEWLDLLLGPEGGTETLPTPAELRDAFILDLLHGRVIGESEARRTGQVLGLTLTWPRAVLLIDAAPFIRRAGESSHRLDSPARQRQRAEQVVDIVCASLVMQGPPICAYIGEGEVVALMAWTGAEAPPAPAGPDGPAWADLAPLKQVAAGLLRRLSYETQTQFTIGLGRYHPGLAGLPRSAHEARAALTLGRRLSGHNAIYCLDDLGSTAFVGMTDEETKRDLARQLLRPLHDEPELQQTLEAFFAAGCSPSITARRLTVHRNTLIYRFDKIAALTGRDPRRFDDAVVLRLALLLLALAPQEENA